jgi:hypothetical protein
MPADPWCWIGSTPPSSADEGLRDAALVVAMTLALAVGSEIAVDAGELTIH